MGWMTNSPFGLRSSLSVVAILVMVQGYAPWMLADLPSFRKLVVTRSSRRTRGMWPDMWERFMHEYSAPGQQPVLRETPAQLNVHGKAGASSWDIGIDLENRVFGYADWPELLGKHHGGSADIAVLCMGLPGILVLSPLLIAQGLLRLGITLATGLSIAEWWVYWQVGKQLSPDDRAVLLLALRAHRDGSEADYHEAVRAKLEEERRLHRLAESFSSWKDTDTFMHQLALGETDEEGIHDHIDDWHRSREPGVKLHQWLGMTWDEYAAWVESRKTLQQLLDDRQAAEAVAAVVHGDHGGCCDDHD